MIEEGKDWKIGGKVRHVDKSLRSHWLCGTPRVPVGLFAYRLGYDPFPTLIPINRKALSNVRRTREDTMYSLMNRACRAYRQHGEIKSILATVV